MQFCKRTLKLRTDQVYKWGYDKKTRIQRELKRKETKISDGISDKGSKDLLSFSVLETLTCLDLNTVVTELLKDVDQWELLVSDTKLHSVENSRKEFCQGKNSDELLGDFANNLHDTLCLDSTDNTLVAPESIKQLIEINSIDKICISTPMLESDYIPENAFFNDLDNHRSDRNLHNTFREYSDEDTSYFKDDDLFKANFEF